MKKYNSKTINKDICEIHKNNIYTCYCFDCNLHLCKECLKNRTHLKHYKNCIDEVQPVKEELDLIDEIIKDYETKIANLNTEKTEKIKELENLLNDNIIKENNILKEKIKMNKEKENEELALINEKYLLDISEIKKKFDKEMELRKKKLESENSEINNKYSLLNKDENNQHQLNVEKLKNNYENDINNLKYDIKIENMKSIKAIVEIIYNTYNAYNNNYYNSLNINKILSIFYQNNYFKNKNKNTLNKLIKNEENIKFKTFKEEIYEYKNELKQIREENEKLKMENHSLNCKINQLNKENKSKNELKDFNERLNGKEFNNINFYDIIINIKSIKDITKGWEVKMSKKMKEKYEDFKTNRSIKIGVLGNSNVGKTFLLSKLCKKDLPHGIRTEGLSIKYPDLSSNKDRNIILLDLCGFETPILTEENEKKDFTKNKELLYDRIYTEMFLQNFFSIIVIFLY